MATDTADRKIVNYRHRLSHAVAGWDKEGTPYLEGVSFAVNPNFEIVGNGTCQHPLEVKDKGSMAALFVTYYRQWEDLTPEDHERSGNTFTNFADFARANAEAQGKELAYLQWWNCKPCNESGVQISNSASAYAVIDFEDGSYAFSPGVSDQHPYRRLWLTGKPG